jgi:hypothetical protein
VGAAGTVVRAGAGVCASAAEAAKKVVRQAPIAARRRMRKRNLERAVIQEFVMTGSSSCSCSTAL